MVSERLPRRPGPGRKYSAWHGGVPLPLHLRDALREVERPVVHLRVVRVWRAAHRLSKAG